jgi:hypothetical protein
MLMNPENHALIVEAVMSFMARWNGGRIDRVDHCIGSDVAVQKLIGISFPLVLDSKYEGTKPK